MKKILVTWMCFVLLIAISAVPAGAASTVIGPGLLTASDANTLAGWLGSGDQTFTNIFNGIPGFPPLPGDPLAFHAAADGYSRTFTLAQVDVHNTVTNAEDIFLVGGYNPLPWKSNYTYDIAFDGAFLFNLTLGLKLNQIFALPDGPYQTLNDPYHGPEFGDGADLYLISRDIDGNIFPDGYAYQSTYGPTNVFGEGFTEFTTLAYSVYATPEPSSLLLVGMGLLAFAGIRKRNQN